MKYSLAVIRILEEQGRSSHYWEEEVFAKSSPDVVSQVYREHVETYLHLDLAKTSTKSLWYKATTWLRGLEKRCRHRLFSNEPQLDPVWWAKHVRTIVGRRPTSIRITLPLEAEIGIFIEALSPHFVAWILGLVDPRKLEVSMYPKTLIQAVYVHIRQRGKFGDIAKVVKKMYPDIARPFCKQEFDEAYYPTRLSHWPGLRIRPPFFPDLAEFHPAPSTTLPFQGKYLVISAVRDAHAKTSILDFHTALLDESFFSKDSFGPSLGLWIDSQQAADVVKALDKIHPRSFRYNDPHSPYAVAATTLTPRISFEPLATKIPENALLGYEMNFSLTYAIPRTDGAVPPITKEEQFFEIKMPGEEDSYVYLSSYVGFGLRMRHTILKHTKPHEIHGHGVCIVVPDGLSRETTENVMLTSIAFLQGLGLKDLKLLSESACQAACLGSIAKLRKSSIATTSWASFHDGPLVCQALAVLHNNLTDALKDLWKDRYQMSPLKDHLLAKIRDYILDHPEVARAVDNLTTNRFAGRTAVVDAVRRQMADIILTLENNEEETTSITLDLSPQEIGSISIPIARDEFRSWVRSCFVHLTSQPWWDELKSSLDHCNGIVVSGGIFGCCPKTALQKFHDILTPTSQKLAKIARLNVLHGACLVIYAEKQCRHFLLSLDDKVGLPIVVSSSK